MRMENMKNEEYHWIDKSETKNHLEYLKYSIELAHTGRLAEAVKELQHQISNHPNCYYLNFQLGILHYDLGEYEEACKAFKKELEISPQFRDAAWELGSACSRLDLRAETIEAYQQALIIDPCCIQALYGLGNAYRRNGDYSEAIEYYEDASFLMPELDRSDPRTDDERAKSLVANIHFNLGVTWMLMKNPEKAQGSFQSVQKIGSGGRLFELADRYLKLLSNVSDNPDFSTWKLTELLPEDI